MKYLTLFVILFFTISCKTEAQSDTKKQNAQLSNVELQKLAVLTLEPVTVPLEHKLARAYFASGCFWCVEAIYESMNGVSEVVNGYSGGHTDNPTYNSSNTGKTGHAEAVEVIYDPAVVSFSVLVDVYFGSQNPTQVNGQGNDIGSQYRSIIFYQNDAQKQTIIDKKNDLENKLQEQVAAEVYPFQKFWIAENYHQNYERLHPNDRYIRNVSIPRLKRFKKKFPELIKGKH
jgi:peptide-methionine (S)-S-oxide reductase